MKRDLKASLFVISLCVVVTFLLYIAVHEAFLDIEENGCDMTYMYEYPKYIEVNLKESISHQFPRYGLYMYGEGSYADKLRRSGPTGIPVLFIPGNAGSHRQVRSLASVALRKAERKTHHFNYFTVDFDEDLGGLFGGILMQQTNFVHICLRHILRMYKNNKHGPESVVLIGHSMGGLIARALYTLQGFQPKMVNFIITLGTPHVGPVIALDVQLTSFYSQVNNFWLSNPVVNNATILSFAGGSRDILVPVRLCSLHHISSTVQQFSAATTALPDIWLTIDHLALCWCKQLILVINRALFDMVDKETGQIRKDKALQRQILEQHFGYYRGEIDGKKETTHSTYKKLTSVIVYNQTFINPSKKYELSISGKLLIPIEFHEDDCHFTALTSDVKGIKIITCAKVQNDSCIGSTDYPSRVLPTSFGKARFIHLTANALAKSSHILISTLNYKPPTSLLLQFTSKDDIDKIFSNFTLFMGFQTFLSRNNIFTNVSLPMLKNCFDVFLITVRKIDCENGNSGLFGGRIHIPWFEEDIYAVPANSQKFDILVKLHTSKSTTVSASPQLHIWSADKCSLKVAVQHQFLPTFGQILKVYATDIPRWIYFWIVAIVTIQISEMSHKGIWLSTWSVVISGKLLRILPIFVLVASEVITEFSRILLGNYWVDVQAYISVNILQLYNWLLPGTFIIFTAFVMVVFTNFIVGLLISFGTRLLICCSSNAGKLPSENSFCSYLIFCCIIGPSLLFLLFLCGSSALYLLTIITFIHCCKKTKDYKELFLTEETTSSTQSCLGNQSNFSKTMLLLLVVLSFQSSPAFVVWLKVFPTSWFLPSDPFFFLVLLLTPTAICSLYLDFKKPPKYASWIILSIWCVTFILCSLDKLTYILGLILLLTDFFVFCKGAKHKKTH